MEKPVYTIERYGYNWIVKWNGEIASFHETRNDALARAHNSAYWSNGIVKHVSMH